MPSCYAGMDDAAPGTSVAVNDALAQADGRARLLVKAMAVAERVGTRFYSLRQARAAVCAIACIQSLHLCSSWTAMCVAQQVLGVVRQL